MPGRITYLWFNPTKPGEHLVTCAEYCGVMHGYMAGRIIVKAPEEYAAWVAEQHREALACKAQVLARQKEEEAARRRERGW